MVVVGLVRHRGGDLPNVDTVQVEHPVSVEPSQRSGPVTPSAVAAVSALDPGFRLAKLEGDAALTYAVTERIDGSLLLDTIERCYFCFRRRRRDVRQATSCTCNACGHIHDLNLKFVVHHGTILRQHVAGSEELLGSDVILVHRLLKNHVVEASGIEAYALFTQPCVDVMDVDVVALGMRAASETYEHVGSVPVWIHDLQLRWEEEQARTRVIVEEGGAMYRADLPTSAPPQVLWEFVTTPGRRVAWQAGVTGVEVTAKGNRRGVGATNHCMHGKGASIEQLLDWRPYDYFTIRNTAPPRWAPCTSCRRPSSSRRRPGRRCICGSRRRRRARSASSPGS